MITLKPVFGQLKITDAEYNPTEKTGIMTFTVPDHNADDRARFHAIDNRYPLEPGTVDTFTLGVGKKGLYTMVGEEMAPKAQIGKSLQPLARLMMDGMGPNFAEATGMPTTRSAAIVVPEALITNVAHCLCAVFMHAYGMANLGQE